MMTTSSNGTLRQIKRFVAPTYRSVRGRVFDGASWYLKARGHQVCALASYPRSGNTWLRALVEHATGETTGSVYHDEVILRGFYGIMIKTHETDMHRYTKAVHLVRNPFDAIESHYHWRRDLAGEQVTWTEHVPQAIKGWKAHTDAWLNSDVPTVLVSFEELKSDTEATLTSILEWLGKKAEKDDIRSAIENSRIERMRKQTPKRLGEKFYRRGKSGLGVESFSEDEQALLHHELDPLIRELGYDW